MSGLGLLPSKCCQLISKFLVFKDFRILELRLKGPIIGILGRAHRPDRIGVIRNQGGKYSRAEDGKTEYQVKLISTGPKCSLVTFLIWKMKEKNL